MRNNGFLAWFFCVAIALAGCGGQTSGSGPVQDSPATISLGAPAPDPISAGATSAALISMGGVPTPQVVCRKDNPNDPGSMSTTSSALSYTAPSSVSSALAISITCTATNGIGQPALATAIFHVSTPAPSVTITAPAANATVSGSVSITASVTNPPSGAQVQFQLDNANLGAAVAVTSGAASMSWDTTTTSNALHTLVATLVGTAVKSAPVSVTVSNTSSVPVLSFSGDPNYFVTSPQGEPVITIGATGIGANTNFVSTLGNIGFWEQTDSIHVKLHLNTSTSLLKSMMFDVSAVNPGSGGGVSNTLTFGFKPVFRSLVCSQTECNLLDISNQQVSVFDKTSGTLLQPFVGHRGSFARDNQTGDLVFGQNFKVVSVLTSTGQPTNHSTDTGGTVAGVAANNGQICASQASDNQMASFDINQTPPHPVLHIPVGTTPWNLAATKQGSQAVCLGFNLGDLAFWAVKLPQSQLLWNPVTLVGFTRLSDITPLSFRGGWDLATNDSGTLGAVLDGLKNQTAVVNLTTGQEIGQRFDLSSFPGHAVILAFNSSDDSLWVALWDDQASVTRFARLVPVTGASVVVPGLTVDYGAADFLVVQNGSAVTLYVGGFDIKTLQPRFSILKP